MRRCGERRQNEVVKVLQEKELKDVSALIFANKQVQSDRWTYAHSPTHRKVCVGVVKEDRMRCSRYSRRRN